MLAVQELVAGTKTDFALAGAILPQNNNRSFLQLEDVFSTTIVHSKKGDEAEVPVGFGIFHRYSPNQVYCSLVSTAREFDTGFVNVECLKSVGAEGGDKRHTLLKIAAVHKELPNLRGLPQYFTAFAEPLACPLLQCIVDQLVTDCFGHQNVELCRNMTVDLYDSESGKDEHSDDLWRDFSGFLVADRFRYAEIDIKRGSLLTALSGAFRSLPSNVSIQPLSPSTRSLFHDYDQSVSVTDRTEYLDFLLELGGIRSFVAIDQQQRQPIGYALGVGDRVLQCYAEEEQVASALLHTLVGSAPSDHSSLVSLFVRIGADHLLGLKLIEAADNIRRVRRFHSRLVPSTVKWTKVFSLNIGAHLF